VGHMRERDFLRDISFGKEIPVSGEFRPALGVAGDTEP